MSTFQGRTAVVTGGNSGIGLATARKLAAQGANVVIMGRDAKTLDAAVKELGPKARGVRGDVAKLPDLDRLFQETKTAFGKVDFLFVNAGLADFRPFTEVDEAFYDKTTDVNVKGAFFTAQKALPLFPKEGGSIVFNTSVVGSKGFPNMSVYAPTKAALRNLVRVLAGELAPRSIRVNAVAPGPIDTPIYGRLGMSAEQTQDFSAGIMAQVPLKRFGKSEEVADAVLFLASPEASYVTGIELSVDGGIGQV